jgi:hypothetical protein
MKRYFPIVVLFVFFLTGCSLLTFQSDIDFSVMYQSDDDFSVTLTIRVDNLVANKHLLDREKHELIPDDGLIFPTRQVAVFDGESVFDVLQRETRNDRIHMVARFTPIINEAYIEAIHNIYAYDAGPLSGWKFSVNGVFPNVSSSSYLLQAGDIIVWAYTLDLGRDLGMDEDEW